MQEFISTKDKQDKTYTSPEGQEKFMSLFKDQQPKTDESIYNFFKRSYLK